MAVKRGKSQARRNGGNRNGLPGWAWLVIGVVLTLGVILAAPRFLKSDGQDGFFRPHPNPDAKPAVASDADDDGVVPDSASADNGRGAPPPKEPEFDFYTLLPGKEVAMSDAELAASARAEQARAQREQAAQAAVARAAANDDNAPDVAAVASDAAKTPPTIAAIAAANPASSNDARYVLQAGAFGASGDAEAVKAKIALLGLGARVESADINGKTMYRVRMGPYGTASELAEAKAKLGNGGLPAMAIKVK